MSQHGDRKHAKLSASGSSRWMNCTPSANLEAKYVAKDVQSDYAAEGELAHELSELYLHHFKGKISDAVLASEIKLIRKNKFFQEEMIEEVKKYVDEVISLYNKLKRQNGSALLFVETKLDLTSWIPEGFGTGDAIIISQKNLYIIDLKYGKGVSVSAENNSQLKLYGLGAYETFGFTYEVETINMVIHQPRLNNYSEVSTTVEDLLSWGATKVKPKAELAQKGKGDKVAGNWCMWCKIKPICRTNSERMLEIAKHDFKNPEVLENHELADILKISATITTWLKSVSSYMTAEALKGDKFSGFKLVEARTNRKIKDLEGLKKIVMAELDSVNDEDFYDRKPKGISGIEKITGKKFVQQMLADYIEKPQGAPILVPESDKRPELHSLESIKNIFDE